MTPTQIANAALASLGCNTITSLSATDTAEARVAGSLYEAAVCTVLEAREWTFAKTRLQLTKSLEAPVFGYSYQYTISSLVISVIRCYNAKGDLVDDWIRETDKVLTNEDAPVYAEVMMRVDESTFSPGCTNAIIAKLAADMAIPLTENAKLADSWEMKYQSRLAAGGASDGKQGRSQVKTAGNVMRGRRY